MLRPLTVAVLSLLAGAAVAAPSGKGRTPGEASAPVLDPVTQEARALYESGVKLYNATQYEQCTLEFQRSHKLKAVPASLFMMAQCEYYAGAFKDAKTHFQRYLDDEKDGAADFVGLAKARLKSIADRKSVFAINTFPEGVDVSIEGTAGQPPVTGTAPNPNFAVPPGHYRIKLSKPQHQTVIAERDIDIVETKTLFFKLDPVPARLAIRTHPRNARLFVNGNFVRNPYDQQVPPGHYQIVAEAPNYQTKEEEFDLAPGTPKEIEIQLPKYGESAHKAFIAWTTFLGAVAGGFLMVALLDNPDLSQNPATPVLILSGAAVGGAVLFAPAIIKFPDYFPEKRALWVMGGEWMGAAEGVAVGLTLNRGIRPTVISSVGGFGAGWATSWLLRDKAPNFGRSAVIQSAAAIGALTGVLSRPALGFDPRYTGPMMLTGLNLGLGAGLAMAYLPDQRRYGPTWKRAVLIDIIAGTGAMIGALASAVQGCVDPDPKIGCTFPTKTVDDQTRTARLTLGVGLVGLAAGAFLTRNVDREESEAFTRPTVDPPPAVSLIPSAPMIVIQDEHGGSTAVPALAAIGRF